MDTKHDGTPQRARPERGVTLIELAVVVAITAIVAAAAVPDFGALLAMRRLQGAAGSLSADLQFARSQALARNRPIRLSVRTNAVASCWIVHTGGAGDCDCAAADQVVCSAGASAIRSVVLPQVGGVSVAGNVGSIVFDPLHGTSSPTGTLRVVDSRGRSVRHVVNIVGRVRSCSPAAAVAGYLAC
ncbi:MAG: GspH/FimT family protein [Caldimonas sp.]